MFCDDPSKNFDGEGQQKRALLSLLSYGNSSDSIVFMGSQHSLENSSFSKECCDPIKTMEPLELSFDSNERRALFCCPSPSKFFEGSSQIFLESTKTWILFLQEEILSPFSQTCKRWRVRGKTRATGERQVEQEAEEASTQKQKYRSQTRGEGGGKRGKRSK